GEGRFAWHELRAADAPAVWDFYAGMFGWTKAEAHDMGPMGVYQTFGANGQAIGGMFTKPADEPSPYWMFYIAVGDIDAAAKRIADGGGKVLNGPMQVPGGAWVSNAMDPQGVAFSVLGTRG
ncbi:MAG: VOC family protein, partial [Proteobacteria bacterium]|nr:VOC family protein [Pseudomonadota bacterium]